ncbi:14574_t:CDS:2 [Entrophospora sp. SA101]|nr:14574_t:CDS:2 [Entrophospora sp. SA101]
MSFFHTLNSKNFLRKQISLYPSTIGKVFRNLSTSKIVNKQYVLLATDYTDNQAYSRRLSVRKAHLDNALKLKEQGIVVAGGGKMVGSLIIYEAESEEFVRNLVKVDPYVIGKVWEKYEIWPFKMALKS